MTAQARQRIDVWLFRARFAKTRAAAARFVAEGGVRVVRDGASRVLDKASSEITVGDTVLLPLRGAMRTVRVDRLGERRGPAAEARLLYSELAADSFA
jgi:ribosomal 50S subunit-recycling heat shock protein